MDSKEEKAIEKLPNIGYSLDLHNKDRRITTSWYPPNWVLIWLPLIILLTVIELIFGVFKVL